MATEVFNNIGELEIYSENPNFYKRQREENDGFNISDEVESISKPMIKAKKEFFESHNNESLTIDTCSKLSYDWKKK